MAPSRRAATTVPTSARPPQTHTSPAAAERAAGLDVVLVLFQLFLSHYVYRATKKKPTNIAVGQASVATMGGKPSPSSSPIMSSTPGKPLKAD